MKLTLINCLEQPPMRGRMVGELPVIDLVIDIVIADAVVLCGWRAEYRHRRWVIKPPIVVRGGYCARRDEFRQSEYVEAVAYLDIERKRRVIQGIADALQKQYDHVIRAIDNWDTPHELMVTN